MVETIIASMLGSFMYDNFEFFKTANKQYEQGYRWEIDYKTRNPNVPAIPLINEVTGEEKVIWVLKTK